jgi:hypothetical protein
VLLPEGIGERVGSRLGVTGSPTRSTEGGTQALQRTETVAVEVAGRKGRVRRPNLVGALVVKAAAHGNPGDAARGRHRRDFVVLARLLRASGFASEELSKKDRQRLRSMIAAINVDNETLLEIPDARVALDRLVVAAKLQN